MKTGKIIISNYTIIIVCLLSRSTCSWNPYSIYDAEVQIVKI